jgi:hypothetical protein
MSFFTTRYCTNEQWLYGVIPLVSGIMFDHEARQLPEGTASLSGGVEKVYSVVEFEYFALECSYMSFLWTARKTIVLFDVCAGVLVLGLVSLLFQRHNLMCTQNHGIS